MMASYTKNLNLLKKDPVADANDTFNIPAMLNDNWDKLDAAVGAAAKGKATTATLTVAGWSGNSQTVNVDGVTADNRVDVAAAPASNEAYTKAKVLCTAQGNGTLTFTCGKTPTAALTVNIGILNL